MTKKTNFGFMKNSSFRIVIFFGVISIVVIFIIQAYWLKITYNHNEIEFDNNVHIALQEVAEQIAAFTNTDVGNQNPVIQVSPSYFVVKLNDTIDMSIIEFYLIKELNRLNITADFEFGTYDCYTEEMIYGNYVSLNDDVVVRSLSLETYNEFTYYFGVKFPTKLQYISRSVTFWSLFSAISVIVLLFFGYSIFTILKQQRFTELQKDFINNMTHEFKTPLSSIKLASDYFLENKDIIANRRLKKYSEIIKDQNERLNLQVERVLQIAKTEKSTFLVNLKRTDLCEILTKCIDIYRTNLNNNGNITFSCDDKKVYVNADEFHLNNIIHNIIDNSIKYSINKPQININVGRNGKKVNVEITDKGIGIDEKYLNKVFKKFYRVPTGNIHDVKGFGLGLYYVKLICKKHKWKINIKSVTNLGTSIKILMPGV